MFLLDFLLLLLFHDSVITLNTRTPDSFPYVLLTHLYRVDSYFNTLDRSFSDRRGVRLICIVTMFC